MRVLVVLLILSVATPVPQALPKDTRNLWQKIFIPKPTPKPKKKSHHTPRKKPVETKPIETKPKQGRTPDLYFIVEPQWMANYWEQIAAWNYPIPDEKYIHFENGKYHVPPTVYRHYDDMVVGRKLQRAR